jgi:hypothetical protein
MYNPQDTRIILKSDFRDFYDYWFDNHYGVGNELTFYRISKGGMNRIEIMEHFKSFGYSVPEFGFVKNMIITPEHKKQMWVVHTNIDVHRGEGKDLVSGEKALSYYPNEFCVSYKGNPESVGKSFRKLVIGNRNFTIFYKSEDDWRSNCGNVECKIDLEYLSNVPRDKVFNRKFCNLPLFAVDGVVYNGEGYYLDFNIAPGIPKEIRSVISDKEIADEIKNWILIQGENYDKKC